MFNNDISRLSAKQKRDCIDWVCRAVLLFLSPSFFVMTTDFVAVLNTFSAVLLLNKWKTDAYQWLPMWLKRLRNDVLHGCVDSVVISTVCCVLLPIQMDHCINGRIQWDSVEFRMIEFSSHVQQMCCFHLIRWLDYEKKRCHLSLLFYQCGLMSLFEGCQVQYKSYMTFFFFLGGGRLRDSKC